MKSKAMTAASVDQYIAGYPKDVQVILRKVRATIGRAAPEAEQAIKYGIPTFVLHGNLVHFGGFKHHVGFFPGSSGIANFKKELADYKTSKGTVQFPYDQPIPYGLITRIVKFRIKESAAQAAAKAKQKRRRRRTTNDANVRGSRRC